MKSGIIFIITAVLVMMFAVAYHHENVTLPRAYGAWVKQTGNENQLTFEEWRSLVKVTEEARTTLQIPIIPVAPIYRK